MFISTIHKILSTDQLARIGATLGQARFVDGRISGGADNNKVNLEVAADTPEYLEVASAIELTIRGNAEFNQTAYPRYMTHPIISRYERGMFFPEHIDSSIMNFGANNPNVHRASAPLGHNYVRSDLSMTLFLNSPDAYSGGELCFKTSFDPVKVKSEAGSAIVYPTGVPHSVRPVTAGVRVAAIFWIQTMLPIDAERRLVYDAYRLYESLKSSRPTSNDCILAERNYYSLLRILAEV